MMENTQDFDREEKTQANAGDLLAPIVKSHEEHLREPFLLKSSISNSGATSKDKDSDSNSEFMPNLSIENNKAVDKSEFRLIESAPAVSVFNNGADYLIAADLARGASLNIVPGDTVQTGIKSVYGGPNPSFKRMTAEEALEKERKFLPDTMAVFNSEFFSNIPKNTVPVAYAFKQDGKIVSEGFASADKHPGERLTLSLGHGQAKIVPFDNNDIEKFRKNKDEQDLVSLSPSVNIDGESARSVGRTFVGLAHPDADGSYTQVLIFVSSGSSQKHAEDTLKAFGAGPVIMFDGGESSQLLYGTHNFVKTARTVPQFLAVTPAPSSQ